MKIKERTITEFLDNEYNEIINNPKLTLITKDDLSNLNLDVWFGKKFRKATGDIKKDGIYQNIMRYTSSWEKRDTDAYNLGWALYFTI